MRPIAEIRKIAAETPEGNSLPLSDEELAAFHRDRKSGPTTEEILAERGKTHGRFEDNARIQQSLKATMRAGGLNWEELPPIMRESLEMVQHKVGRILTGNPNEPDHWDDVAGYAKLVANWLREQSNEKPS